jgi:hypothetical protein
MNWIEAYNRGPIPCTGRHCDICGKGASDIFDHVFCLNYLERLAIYWEKFEKDPTQRTAIINE